MKKSIEEGLQKAISYTSYRKIISDLIASGKSSGPIQSEDLLNYSKLNDRRMTRLDKTIQLSQETLLALKKINNPIYTTNINYASIPNSNLNLFENYIWDREIPNGLSIYEKQNNEKPKVVACHAGLECGILGTNYPEMDMISFGPTIHGAHSPDERASIKSSQKFWKFVLEILENIPLKK